jgi:hypothetical protein
VLGSAAARNLEGTLAARLYSPGDDSVSSRVTLPVVWCPDNILLPCHMEQRGGLQRDGHRGPVCSFAPTNTRNFGMSVRTEIAALYWVVSGTAGLNAQYYILDS